MYLTKFIYYVCESEMSRDIRFPTMWYVSDQSFCLSLEYSMSVKLLTEHHFEFLSLKGSCTGPPESTLVKMPHCWKSRHGSNVQINATFNIGPYFKTCLSFHFKTCYFSQCNVAAPVLALNNFRKSEQIQKSK